MCCECSWIHWWGSCNTPCFRCCPTMLGEWPSRVGWNWRGLARKERLLFQCQLPSVWLTLSEWLWYLPISITCLVLKGAGGATRGPALKQPLAGLRLSYWRTDPVLTSHLNSLLVASQVPPASQLSLSQIHPAIHSTAQLIFLNTPYVKYSSHRPTMALWGLLDVHDTPGTCLQGSLWFTIILLSFLLAELFSRLLPDHVLIPTWYLPWPLQFYICVLFYQHSCKFLKTSNLLWAQHRTRHVVLVNTQEMLLDLISSFVALQEAPREE